MATGVPKTIDNDLGDAEFTLLDHSPGYGSVARYYAHYIRQANEENAGSAPADPVLVIQAMGRKIGFIPAAARLADPERKLPIQIYLTESGLTLPQLGENVIRQLESDGRCIVVVSEGFDVGDLGDDPRQLRPRPVQLEPADGRPDRRQLSQYAQVPRPRQGPRPGTRDRPAQRHRLRQRHRPRGSLRRRLPRRRRSPARRGTAGWPPCSATASRSGYSVHYDKVPLEKVANSERFFPKHWLAPSRIDVTDEFLEYATPLIGEDWVSVPTVKGLPRFARIARTFAARKLPDYVPETYRKEG